MGVAELDGGLDRVDQLTIDAAISGRLVPCCSGTESDLCVNYPLAFVILNC